MGHQVGLTGAGDCIRPVTKGAQRHQGPQGPRTPALGEGAASQTPPCGRQPPVDGGGAHPQHRRAHHRLQLQFPMPLQGLQQRWQHPHQPLGAEPVAGFPQLLQGVDHGHPIHHGPSVAAFEGCGGPPQCPYRRFPVVARHRTDLVQQRPALPLRCSPVSLSHPFQILLHARRTHGHLLRVR